MSLENIVVLQRINQKDFGFSGTCSVIILVKCELGIKFTFDKKIKFRTSGRLKLVKGNVSRIKIAFCALYT
jgi:hypothetical protein